MNGQTNAALWDYFFGLKTIGDLRKFSAHLDPTFPEEAALSYYISSWADGEQLADNAAFLPNRMVSPDRSAVMYGNAPVIFEGTNYWSSKPYFSAAELLEKMNNFENLVAGIRASNTNARMTLLLIPEKDHVISRFLLKEDRFAAFEAAVDALTERMAKHGVSLVFQQPFHGIDRFQSTADFAYPDSHLAGRNYVTMFGFVLETLGVSWASIKSHIGLRRLPEFGDLARKFEDVKTSPLLTLQPDVLDSKVTQSAGSETFAEPLGETWQEFSNAAPLVDQSVCLLGDSHCSIYAKRKLTYLFANTFRNTHFEWNPCGIRKKPDVSSFDNVLLEISSRFVV